jgi:hypothetical protein
MFLQHAALLPGHACTAALRFRKGIPCAGTCAQLEDVLSWDCGHPGHARQLLGGIAGSVGGAGVGAGGAAGGAGGNAAERGNLTELRLGALSGLEAAEERYANSAFSDEDEDEDELRRYVVRELAQVGSRPPACSGSRLCCCMLAGPLMGSSSA